MDTKKIKMEDVPAVLGTVVEMLEILTEKVNALTLEISKKPKPALTLDDAAKILHKSKSAIYHLVSARVIPFHKNGKRLYFFHDELIEWLENTPNSQNKSLAYAPLSRSEMSQKLKQILNDNP